jgi:carbon monoxide dehydrogenase subunit G
LAPITASAEIARAPEEVFAYVTDPSRFDEWQENVLDGRMEGSGIGARCISTRQIGLMKRASTSEVTELSPPRAWSVRGIDGPIRAQVDVRVEPLDGGARSRATIDVDFEGHGMGKLLVPMVVRREAEKEMPRNLRRLKERLEQAQ